MARWLLALAAPAAALALAVALRPLVSQVPGPPFVAAIMLVAWLGGLGPALLTIALSLGALAYYFLPPTGSLAVFPSDAVWLLLFAAVALCTAWVVATRGRAQSRLAASEQQLRVVTDTAPVLISYVDRRRRYRFANRPYAEHHGRTPEDVVGRSMAEVVGAERYATLEGPLTAALDGRRTVVEVTHAGEEGPRHLLATYVPDPGPRGTVRGVVAVINDITDRKRADDERVRLLALEQSRRSEAEAVAELGRMLRQGLDLDAVAPRIAELARGLLRAVVAIVYRVDPVSRDLVRLATSGDIGPLPPGGILPRGAGAVGRAVERGGPVTSANVLDDPEVDTPPGTREWIEQAPHRAVLAVPLQIKGRIVGALAAGDRLGRVFGTDEVRLAEALADHAAVALENARLYTEAEERRREAELLAELARALSASLDLDTVLGRVTAAARDLCNADLARIALWDERREGLTFRYTVGTRAGEPDRVLLTPGQGLAGEVLATGRPVRIGSALDDPRRPDYAGTIGDEGSLAVLVAPIRMGERVEGLLYVDNRKARAFSDRDEAVLVRLADHAASALRNAQLFAGEQAARADAETRAQRARLLADVSRALASSLHYEATLDAVAHLVVPARADWCVVHLARRDGGVRRVAAAYADPANAALAAETVRIAPTVDWLRDVSPAVESVRAGRSLLVAHATPARIEEIVTDPADRRIFLALQPRSMLVAPLVARGRALGSITWLRIASTEPYTAEDLGLAENIAARAALAVDNARLYRQAQRARGEAEGANQAKDEFLAVLSHELRTPLTSMLGWLRLLRTGQLGPERVAQALEVVERNTRAQAQLINDLLDVSRIVAGKLQLDLYPVDLTPILEESVESARRDAQAKGVEIELTVSAGCGLVLGDPLRLGQIAANLVANAVKFTPAGGRVCVRLAREGGEAVVTVADTGIGIPPELLAHVFDRFRQADSTITRRYGGLGLGLAIVRHLAELHGGGVRVESRGEGQGATFIVRLPVAEPEGRRGRGEPAVTSGTVPARPRALAGLRLLVVEDHLDTAELLRAVLGGQGADVRVAASLAEALAALEAADVDVLVSDIAMPDGNGYDLLRRLRERERTSGRRSVPAVAVTAFAGGDEGDRARAAGFDEYAAKPIDPAALVEVVARAAGRRAYDLAP
ncbi:MAG TPA: GAF domain-containing protein [Methylomirabilota bacterium]|nr:GAF domain-containing protein [Methylomirabilota bacterium]